MVALVLFPDQQQQKDLCCLQLLIMVAKLQLLNTLRLGVLYTVFVLWNLPKTSSCQLPYQHHSYSTNCATKLFKGSNRSASLLVCTREKIFLVGGCGFFVSDIISEVVLGPFWLMLPGAGPNR